MTETDTRDPFALARAGDDAAIVALFREWITEVFLAGGSRATRRRSMTPVLE